ncbi:MAG: recombinase family protein [Planctomycetaceae bacterium]
MSASYTQVADGAPLCSVANFLTEKGLPKCANSFLSEWSERNVIDLIRRTIYRGVELYREHVSEKQCRTGTKKSVPNSDPSMVLSRDMPHLRMVEDWLWHKANNAIDDRARPGEHPAGHKHPLHGIPRDSRSPVSNLFVCGICGSKMYMTGRNEGGYRCSAAVHGKCWNKTTALRELTHQRIGSAISRAILEASQTAVPELLKFIEDRLANRGDLAKHQADLLRRQVELKLEQDRLIKVITKSDDPPDFLSQKLKALDAEARQLELDKRLLEEQFIAHVEVPSHDELFRRLQVKANNFSLDNPDTWAFLQRFIDGQIRAIPCQQFGSGKVVLRAEFTLQLVQLIPANVRLHLRKLESSSSETSTVPRRKIILDLFEPSKAPLHAIRALELYRKEPDKPATLDQIAAQLDISKRTAHLALQMGRQLQASGRTDPFLPLTECPENPARWKFKDAS